MSQDRSRNKATAQRPVTIRRESGRNREEQLTRILLAVATVGAVVALLLIAVPFLKRNVLDPRQTLATVGDQRITRSLYEKQQKLTNAQLGDPQTLPLLVEPIRTNPENIREAIQQQLDQAGAAGTEVDPQLLDQMVNQAVLVEAAPQAGVTASESDISQKLDSYFKPAPAAAVGTPTAGAAAAGTPASAATPIAAAPAGTSAPAVPTTPPATPEDVEKVFDLMNDSTGVSRQDYERLVVAPALVTERYAEKNVPRSAEQVHVRHILVPDEAAAKKVLADLKGGRKFEELARERSTDPANNTKGGDLGWAPRGVYDKAFEDAAFALRTMGQLSGPVKSQFGYHVIQLLERAESRPLSEQQRQTLTQVKLSRFVQDQRKRLSAAERLEIEGPRVLTPAPTSVASPAPAP